MIDFEVVHWGDPAFDVAFMSSHLLLKAINRPRSLDIYRNCALSFWGAYSGRVEPVLLPDVAYVLGHVGCLMVARVDGKSPAEYLTDRHRETARRVGMNLLLDPPDTFDEAWSHL